MLFFSEELLTDNENFFNLIDKEIESTSKLLKSQQDTRISLLKFIQEFVKASYSIPSCYSNQLLQTLNNFKKNLKASAINIELLENLIILLNTIKTNKEQILNNIDEINSTISTINKTILKNNSEIFKTLNLSLSLFLNEPETEILDEEIIVPIIKKQELNLIENTLVISEKMQKIFLPYTISILQDKVNTNTYSSIEDAIEKEYTLPINQFKIPSFSRFREAFKLMKEKENSSTKEAFDLAIELFFNYNLHPAIISACKNIDELDIYLDYLSDNETDKFKCFDIVFESFPTITHKYKK